jgi:hypothetical protein
MRALRRSSQASKRDLIPDAIFAALAIIVSLIALPPIVVYVQGQSFDVRIGLIAFVAYAVYIDIDLFEKETGQSVLHRPRVAYVIESNDNQGIRDSIYEVAKRLSPDKVVLKAEEMYDTGTRVEDKFPYSISLSLDFYEHGSTWYSPSKSALCFIRFDSMVLSVSCKLFGNREPFRRLEDAVRKEFSRRGIRLAQKALEEKRPS